ncbi:adenylate/guanylate cyclase domain-containing protein [Kaarinaea lacus]
MMNQSNKYLIFAYYLLSVAILSVFAFRSYAHLGTQPGVEFIMAVAAPFLLAALIHPYVDKLIVFPAHLLDQPKRQFVVDFGFYLLIAAFLYCFERFFYFESTWVAFKLFVWTVVLGYFASIDSSLNREQLCFKDEKQSFQLDSNSSPVAHRLNLFLSVTVLIVTLTIAITAYSYMGIELDLQETDDMTIKQAFIIDTLFIVGIVVSFTVRLIYSFSMNLQYLFDSQVDILRNVQEGKLEELVPVLSRDEFGIIAHQTNVMIRELREKQKVQKTLEQIVSPGIMHKLLNGDAQDLKQGQEYEIAILFCDLRKFTTYAENTPPEQVIFFLNSYFTKISDIVTEHGGIINKFMGDAILAVFGIDGGSRYIEDAVDTAWDILMHSGSIKLRDGSQFEIGIGVHKGRAAAGTIGSADRYEYTFIGDAVNTASRLDGLTKRLGYNLITSAEVYNELGSDSKEKFADLGWQTIRGKSTAVHVYGAAPSNSMGDDEKVIPFSYSKLFV